MIDRIRARRLRFMGLAMVGCNPSPRPTNVAVIEPVDAAPIPSATVPDPVFDASKPPPKRASRIEIPEGISQETRARYERLDQSVSGVYDGVDSARRKIKDAPRCPGAACDAYWRDLAGELDDLRSRVGWFGYYCPEKRPETDLFLEAVERERKAAYQAVDALTSEAIGALGPNGASLLDRYRADYDAAHPRPCLSIACDRW